MIASVYNKKANPTGYLSVVANNANNIDQFSNLDNLPSSLKQIKDFIDLQKQRLGYTNVQPTTFSLEQVASKFGFPGTLTKELIAIKKSWQALAEKIEQFYKNMEKLYRSLQNLERVAGSVQSKIEILKAAGVDDAEIVDAQEQLETIQDNIKAEKEKLENPPLPDTSAQKKLANKIEKTKEKVVSVKEKVERRIEQFVTPIAATTVVVHRAVNTNRVAPQEPDNTGEDLSQKVERLRRKGRYIKARFTRNAKTIMRRMSADTSSDEQNTPPSTPQNSETATTAGTNGTQPKNNTKPNPGPRPTA